MKTIIKNRLAATTLCASFLGLVVPGSVAAAPDAAGLFPFAISSTLSGSFEIARRGRGADDGADHQRGGGKGRGADDGANHTWRFQPDDVQQMARRGRGADDGTGDDRGGAGGGADDGANHT